MRIGLALAACLVVVMARPASGQIDWSDDPAEWSQIKEEKLSIVKELHDDAYNQMVSKIDPDNPDILYSSAWGEDVDGPSAGGLIAFDVSTQEAPEKSAG